MQEFFHVSVSSYDAAKDHFVVRPASLDHPKDHAVMFITQGRMEQADVFLGVKSCLIFWPEAVPVPEQISALHAVVRCDNPHTEFCRFFRDRRITHLPPKEDVRFEGGAWIAQSAVIGAGAQILPGAYVGGECTLGDNVYIGAGAKLMGRVTVGNNVVIRENAVIGADGLTTDREADGSAVTMPQFGGVVIEDGVQIGANTVVARGAIDDTRICRGAKIDNCCFISHNVCVDEDTFIVGETILFGSSSVGKRCLISGSCTVANAVHIGDDSLLGMGATALKDVPSGVVAFGSPVNTVRKK